jgi:hypothetical protein
MDDNSGDSDDDGEDGDEEVVSVECGFGFVAEIPLILGSWFERMDTVAVQITMKLIEMIFLTLKVLEGLLSSGPSTRLAPFAIQANYWDSFKNQTLEALKINTGRQHKMDIQIDDADRGLLDPIAWNRRNCRVVAEGLWGAVFPETSVARMVVCDFIIGDLVQ